MGDAAASPGPLLLCACGMALAGILSVALWWWCARGRLSWVTWGALVWAVAVLVKGALYWLSTWVTDPLSEMAPQWLYIAFEAPLEGLLTGLTEVVFAYFVAKRLAYVLYAQGTGFGLGMGAVEAVLLSLSPLLGAAALIFAPEALTTEDTAALGEATWATALASPTERLISVVAHVAWGVLVVRSLAERRSTWFWLAFAHASALDGVASLLWLTGAVETWSPWCLELAFVPFALLAVGLIALSRRGWPTKPEPPAAPEGLTWYAPARVDESDTGPEKP